MKVLVLNAGSSSLKYQLIDMDNEELIAKGNAERVGLEKAFLKHKAKGVETIIEKDLPNHTVALNLILSTLCDSQVGVIKDVSEIDAVGHRVLHGGEIYKSAVYVDDEVLDNLKKLIPLGPLHMPANIAGIEACKKIMPNVPNVALFDTGFHSTMEKSAYLYATPYEWYEKYGVRRYGFHGISHDYIARKVAEIENSNDLKIISCHIGNGASLCAIDHGKCVDTSMGITPLEGLIMGTRCGDIDPAIVEFVMNKEDMGIRTMLNILNKKSGLLGLSGISSDIRDILAEANKGNERAQIAVDCYVNRIKKYIGSYAAVLGGVDVIVFTAGTGENRDEIREAVMKNMEFLGVDFDFEANRNFKRGEICLISKPSSKVKVYVIPTDEELMIARETVDLLEKKKN